MQLLLLSLPSREERDANGEMIDCFNKYEK